MFVAQRKYGRDNAIHGQTITPTFHCAQFDISALRGTQIGCIAFNIYKEITA